MIKLRKEEEKTFTNI